MNPLVLIMGQVTMIREMTMDDTHQQIEIYEERLSNIRGKTPADEGRRGVIEDDIARLKIESQKGLGK